MELEALLELRERVLTPGHPGRPVIWPYDSEATHYGMFIENQLVGCASITPQEMPGRSATKPYHLHSMAIEPAWQQGGRGREMLTKIIAAVASDDGDLIWATARHPAVGFYQRCGFEAGDETRVQPTNAPMRYVWLTLP